MESVPIMTSPSLYAILTHEHRQDAARLLTEAIPDKARHREHHEKIGLALTKMNKDEAIGVNPEAAGIRLVVIGVIEA
jgi:hypothetical protein